MFLSKRAERVLDWVTVALCFLGAIIVAFSIYNTLNQEVSVHPSIQTPTTTQPIISEP